MQRLHQLAGSVEVVGPLQRHRQRNAAVSRRRDARARARCPPARRAGALGREGRDRCRGRRGTRPCRGGPGPRRRARGLRRPRQQQARRGRVGSTPTLHLSWRASKPGRVRWQHGAASRPPQSAGLCVRAAVPRPSRPRAHRHGRDGGARGARRAVAMGGHAFEEFASSGRVSGRDVLIRRVHLASHDLVRLCRRCHLGGLLEQPGGRIRSASCRRVLGCLLDRRRDAGIGRVLAQAEMARLLFRIRDQRGQPMVEPASILL